jgi:hypothetical protein
MGIVARAALRIREEGDMVVSKRYSTMPFFKMVTRIGLKVKPRPEGEYPLTRNELAEVKALASEIAPLD